MYTAIRLRGSVNVRPKIRDTLRMLRLNRINHCVVLDETPHNKGMIQVVKDYIAWGHINPETLALLLEKRGELEGGKPLTGDYLAEHTPYKTIRELAEAVCRGDYRLKDVPGLKPVFRLHPPRKGHRGIKRTYQQGGELGFHGEDINILIRKMR